MNRADADAIRPEERISGPYQIPLSKVNKRSSLGRLAHEAAENGWDVYVYECINYSGDTVMKNGKIKLGKEEPYTWVVGKILRDKWYVFKYSQYASWVNKVGFSYDELRAFISRPESERDFLV